MKKKTAINLLKYALAVGLLVYVIWSNWGYRDHAAKLISDHDNLARMKEKSGVPTIVGTVVAYEKGTSITVAPEDNPEHPVQYAIQKKTALEVDEEDRALAPGTGVAVWEAPRGLAYVWFHHLVTREEKVDWSYFFIAMVLNTIGILFTLIRWWTLVRAQDIPLPLKDGLRLGMVGIFFNTFLPGSVGGDIIKGAFIARERKDRRATAVATVLLDRLIALWGLICLLCVAGGIFWAVGLLDKQPAQRIVMTATALVLMTLVAWTIMGFLPEHRATLFAGRLSRVPKVGHSLAEVWGAVWMYRCRQKSVGIALLLSWCAHVCFLLTYFFCALTLSSSLEVPSLAEHFLIVPIGLVIQAVPLFPGGAGIGELGFGGLYQLFGFAAANGILMSLVLRVINWIVGGLCYIVYLRMKPTIQATVADSEKTIPPNPRPNIQRETAVVA